MKNPQIMKYCILISITLIFLSSCKDRSEVPVKAETYAEHNIIKDPNYIQFDLFDLQTKDSIRITKQRFINVTSRLWNTSYPDSSDLTTKIGFPRDTFFNSYLEDIQFSFLPSVRIKNSLKSDTNYLIEIYKSMYKIGSYEFAENQNPSKKSIDITSVNEGPKFHINTMDMLDRLDFSKSYFYVDNLIRNTSSQKQANLYVMKGRFAVYLNSGNRSFQIKNGIFNFEVGNVYLFN